MSPETDVDAPVSLFHPSVKATRAATTKAALGSFVAILLAIWILLPVFYGSVYLIEALFYRINIDVYDFDSVATGSPLVGPGVVQALVASMQQSVHFTFRIVDPRNASSTGGLITIGEIENGIVNEAAWAAVVINSNATAAWQQAVAGGVTMYDGRGAISVVITSARFFQVILEYLLPFLAVLLAPPLLSASQDAVASTLATATPATLANLNAGQLSALSSPFSFLVVDLRPILSYQWSGSAPLQAGLIYYIIFGFHVALFLFIGRIPLQFIGKKKLAISYRSLLLLRFVPVTIAYFFLSLWYSLINVTFSVPMNGNGHSGLSSGAGFMVFWALNFLTLGSLGLAMESAVTILGLKFLPFFLISWIIVNITSSFFPISLMQTFYRFGYALPFWHSTTADKYLFWGARNRLALNFGVLIAWILISVISLSSAEWVLRSKAEKAALEEERLKGSKEKEALQEPV